MEIPLTLPIEEPWIHAGVLQKLDQQPNQTWHQDKSKALDVTMECHLGEGMR